MNEQPTIVVNNNATPDTKEEFFKHLKVRQKYFDDLVSVRKDCFRIATDFLVKEHQLEMEKVNSFPDYFDNITTKYPLSEDCFKLASKIEEYLFNGYSKSGLEESTKEKLKRASDYIEKLKPSLKSQEEQNVKNDCSNSAEDLVKFIKSSDAERGVFYIECPTTFNELEYIKKIFKQLNTQRKS